MPEEEPKVAIYCRVSREDLKLENQILPLERYARQQRWNYDIFTEKESTRKTRPVQYDVYKRLLRGEFNTLLVYKFDRWARNMVEIVMHMNEFKDRGVRFISLTENLDLGTSSGRMMFHMIAALAEFERDLIRERTMAGLDRARARGKKLGRPFKKDRR